MRHTKVLEFILLLEQYLSSGNLLTQERKHDTQRLVLFIQVQKTVMRYYSMDLEYGNVNREFRKKSECIGYKFRDMQMSLLLCCLV